MRIAIGSLYDAWDKNSWSGIPFHVLTLLRSSGWEVISLGPLQRTRSVSTIGRRMKAKVLRQNYLTHRDIDIVRGYGRQLTEKTRDTDADCILCFGTAAASFLESDRPIVLFNDATFAAMLDYYPAWTDLSRKMIETGHEIEKRAFDRADSLIFASEWAAVSARRHYGVPMEKIHVIPMGANVVEPNRAAILELAKAKNGAACELLFIGYDWHRKGGDIALRIRRRLEESGIDARLTIVGCDPYRQQPVESGVTVQGVLDKRKPEDALRLEMLLRRSHFLVHPARAECYGIVLCEANAFGLPVIGSATGGMPSIIQNHVNGYLQDDIEDIDGFCRFIVEHSAPDKYAVLSLSSHDRFTRHLSWHGNRERIAAIVRATVEGCRSP